MEACWINKKWQSFLISPAWYKLLSTAPQTLLSTMAVFGITKNGQPCKLCLAKCDFCKKHDDQRYSNVNHHHLNHHNNNSTSSPGSQASRSSSAAIAMTKKRTPCKLCIRQGRNCHYHIGREEEDDNDDDDDDDDESDYEKDFGDPTTGPEKNNKMEVVLSGLDTTTYDNIIAFDKTSNNSWKPQKNLDRSVAKGAKNVRGRLLHKIGKAERPLEPQERGESPFADSNVETSVVEMMARPVQFVSDSSKPGEVNFLKLLGRPILDYKLVFPARTSKVIGNLDSEIVDNGVTYTLVASKSAADQNKNPYMSWARSKAIDFKYLAIRGPGLTEWDPKKDLERIADFQSLPRHKVAARLELFLTPAKDKNSYFSDLKADNFEVLEEEDSHMGCGFIPDSFVADLFPRKRILAKLDSFQVRIFCPRIGIAKGMLTRKFGITKIQLPPSMIKVGPSRDCRDDWAVLIIKGIVPAESNSLLGRYLDPITTAPKSYVAQKVKELSPMLRTLLVGLGVPQDVMTSYTQQARAVAGLKHTFLMGVCDETGMLPEGSIFIPGYCCKNDTEERVLFSSHLERILVTRSPCLEPSDCKMLPLVGTKPADMPVDIWERLCSKPFGTIIFSKPRDRINAAPLPALVGEGDLDGDLYFVLFDKVVISHLEKIFDDPIMRAEIKQQEDELRKKQVNLSEGPTYKEDISQDDDWFAAVQTEMTNVDYHSKTDALIGKMYNLSQKIAADSSEGIRDLHARACAKAYKAALDNRKHATNLELPSALKIELNKSFHPYITWT